MKVEENVYLCKLFDAYGELLSLGQKKILSYYLDNDLTLSEIAENLGISRQAIRDSILKAENKLRRYEEKLCFIKKIEAYQKEVENLKLKQKK